MCIPYLYADFFLQLGFDSLFFARIDYQDRAKRLKDKTLEVIWRGSKSLGSSSQVSSLQYSWPYHDYDSPFSLLKLGLNPSHLISAYYI